MNPDLLAELRRLFMPSAPADATANPAPPRKVGLMQSIKDERDRIQRVTEGALNSPLGDTLMAVSGGGKPSIDALDLSTRNKLIAPIYDFFVPPNPVTGFGYRAGGIYHPKKDAVTLKSPQSLAHEMGHRRDFRVENRPSNDMRFVVPTLPMETRGDVIARADIDPYYRKNDIEAYASAFDNAISLLRSFAGDTAGTRDDYTNALVRKERETPGTGYIVESLLKEPIYSNHPVRRFYRSVK